MVSTQSTRQNNHSDRVAGSRGSSFVRNRTGPFTTALTTVGGGGAATGSHAVFHHMQWLWEPQSYNLQLPHMPRLSPTVSQHIRATAKQYMPSTPLKVDHLWVLLQHHPQQDRVNYMLKGLLQGFSLEYEGQCSFRVLDNLPSADIKPELIRERLQKEVQLSRMWGPFQEPPFEHLMCSLVGLVLKKDMNEKHMIMHQFPIWILNKWLYWSG